jgi:AcrR family transcriptional regulator
VVAGKRREADARVEHSKRLVLQTTSELLRKGGLGGVSVDEVARRSGVAKTTIYRHWPSRGSLLMEACRDLSWKPQALDTGSLRGDLEALALAAAAKLRQPWSSVLPSILDAAERDKDLAQLQARQHGDMRAAFALAIQRGQARGELPSREQVPELIASIMGPLVYRRWFSREALDDAFVRRVVARALRADD